jgi:hypothetical protein
LPWQRGKDVDGRITSGQGDSERRLRFGWTPL